MELEEVQDAAAFTCDVASKAFKAISDPLSAINNTLSLIKNQLEDLKTSYDIKTRIIDMIEFMLRTLDNIAIHKQHNELDAICEQLEIAKESCDQAIEKYNGHKLPILDGIRKTWNASSIKEDLQWVEKKIKLANQKLATCLTMLNAEDLAESKQRIDEIKQVLQNPDRGIYFSADDMNLPPTFKLSAKPLANGLELSWEPVSDCSDTKTAVEKYELWYDKDRNDCQRINDRNCTKVTLSTSLIKPGKTYSMEIRGINKSGGKGNWSETIVVTLSKPVPSKPPTPKITIVNHKEALVTVQNPTRSCDTESFVKQWLVEYKGSDTEWEKLESTANSDTQNIPVKNLVPKKVYHFRVCAVNDEGASQPSDLVTKNTSNVDPLQPVNLHLSSEISHSVLIINWQMPTGSLEFITHYEVTKRAERDFVYDKPKKVEDKKAISYKFEKLKSKTKYFFQVCACNDNGISNWAEILGETCSKTSALTSFLVAKLPIGKKDAKNKDGACNSIFYVDNDERSINDSNTGGESNKDDEHSSDDEDTYHDALASSLVAKFDMKEGKSKDSAIDQSDDDDDDTNVEDKTDKDNNNTNKHNKSVEPNQDSNYTHDDSTVNEFRERFTNILSHRPTKGTQ